MVLNVEIINGRDFLKTTAKGELDLTKSKKLLHAIVTKARKHKDHHLLIDIRGTTSPRMGTIDLYNIVMEMEKYKDVLKNKIVVIDDDKSLYCNLVLTHLDNNHKLFLENVINSSFVNIKYEQDVYTILHYAVNNKFYDLVDEIYRRGKIGKNRISRTTAANTAIHKTSLVRIFPLVR